MPSAVPSDDPQKGAAPSSERAHASPQPGSEGAGLEASERLAWTIARAADEAKASDIVLLRVNEVCYLADYFVLGSGSSKTQVRAISDAIQARVASQLAQQPVRLEGESERSWIVQDYGDAIAHILLPQERDFYNIEAFWGHAERIDFVPGVGG
ncbi:MAG: ribosome silencing factor [Cyanobacteria bacterium QS_8_64_29]|nr:MAG: ribosome silencing factor [Cyanobacteria bacterium QS_8_64_29]